MANKKLLTLAEQNDTVAHGLLTTNINKEILYKVAALKQIKGETGKSFASVTITDVINEAVIEYFKYETEKEKETSTVDGNKVVQILQKMPKKLKQELENNSKETGESMSKIFTKIIDQYISNKVEELNKLIEILAKLNKQV